MSMPRSVLHRSKGLGNIAARLVGILVALASLLVLPGCWVYSLNPLYDTGIARDPDVVFDQALIGAWGRLDGSCQWTLTVNTSPDAYQMTIAPGQGCSDDEKKKSYEAHLVRVDTHRFLDVAARSEEVCDLCLPLHSIFLLAQEKSQEGESLTLTPLDITWMTQALNSKRAVLPHLPHQGPARPSEVLRASDAVYLTASSTELKKFVAKYADDKAAFRADSEAVIKFKRK
jgi:hypothetical protein